MDKATLTEAPISQVEQCPARLDVRSQARSSMKMYGKRAEIHAAVKCNLKAKFAYNPRSACWSALPPYIMLVCIAVKPRYKKKFALPATPKGKVRI